MPMQVLLTPVGSIWEPSCNLPDESLSHARHTISALDGVALLSNCHAQMQALQACPGLQSRAAPGVLTELLW